MASNINSNSIRQLINELLSIRIFGCPVIQGYGLTETAAGATIMEFNDAENGHIGAPCGCCGMWRHPPLPILI